MTNRIRASLRVGISLALMKLAPAQEASPPPVQVTIDNYSRAQTNVYFELISKSWCKRFADSGGWGWAAFDYDPESNTFSPGTLADKPPQGNDAKCGLACHTSVKKRDYVFTEYAHR